MGRFGEKEMSKENFYAPKKLIKIWYGNVDNIVISKLIETKNNSNYLIVMNSDKAIRPFVLIMSKMSGYLNSFKVEEGSNKLMSFFPYRRRKIFRKIYNYLD